MDLLPLAWDWVLKGFFSLTRIIQIGKISVGVSNIFFRNESNNDNGSGFTTSFDLWIFVNNADNRPPRQTPSLPPAPSCTRSLVAASDTWTETPKRTSKDGKAETPQLEALADPLINLLGGGFNYFLFSPLPGDPIWLIFFKQAETTK